MLIYETPGVDLIGQTGPLQEKYALLPTGPSPASLYISYVIYFSSSSLELSLSAFLLPL